jgi:hypothetical protein
MIGAAATSAVAGAVGYGVSDYLGGDVSRDLPVPITLALAQTVGLVLFAAMLPLSLLLAGAPFGWPSATVLWWGAAGGLCGTVGLGLLYQALAVGPMSVVSPTAAVAQATVPVTAALLAGRRPSLLVVAGAAAAFIALPLLSPKGDRGERRSLAGPLTALAAGGLLGLFSVCLAHTPPTAGLWPLLSDRAVSLCLTVPLVAVLYHRGRIPANGARPVLAAAACGAIMAAGDIAVLYATRVDLLTAGPLIALYPAVTVACARILGHEGIPRRRRLGLVFAGVAVLALTIGG